jgi:mannose-6-phosphate isomerase
MLESEIGYPIKFTPILKEKIWGGTKLKNVLSKKSPTDSIGESWELSGVDGDISIISNGFLVGKSIREIIEEYKGEIVGEKVYKEFGAIFPLLFKFIDANDDLSIQLHPNDELAAKRHNSFGKTEMWYVVDADEDARLIVGFNGEYSKEAYINELEADNLLHILNTVSIKKGDSFFIEVGTIHAIGKGSLVAEIQQTSDITYRVFDWNRKDNFGNERELHNDLAMDALDFTKKTTCQVEYLNNMNESSNIVDCNYFTTNKINIDSSYNLDIEDLDSFVVYMCIEGTAIIKIGNDFEEINKGETLLIPAVSKRIEIKSESAELLEVYINQHG